MPLQSSRVAFIFLDYFDFEIVIVLVFEDEGDGDGFDP